MNDNDLLRLVMEAGRLIDANQPLTKEHLEALRPFCKTLENKLKPKGETNFIGNVSSGFFVCSTTFSGLLGLGHIHKLLAQAENQIEESKSIPAVVLDSWGTMGKSGYMLFGEEPGIFTSDHYDGDQAVSPFQGSLADEEIIWDVREAMEAHVEELESQGETSETNPILKKFKKELKNKIYRGKAKPFDNDPDAARKRVGEDISYAIQKLIDCEDTKHVGLHLKDTIITGIDCVYIGGWKWKLF